MRRWPFVVGFIILAFAIAIRKSRYNAEVLSDSISALFYVAEIACAMIALAIKKDKP